MKAENMKQLAARLRMQCIEQKPELDAVEFSVTAYETILTDPDLTIDQRSEFLESLLGAIIDLAYMDYGFHFVR